jgi:hypothetical protein
MGLVKRVLSLFKKESQKPEQHTAQTEQYDKQEVQYRIAAQNYATMVNALVAQIYGDNSPESAKVFSIIYDHDALFRRDPRDDDRSSGLRFSTREYDAAKQVFEAYLAERLAQRATYRAVGPDRRQRFHMAVMEDSREIIESSPFYERFSKREES